MALSGQPISTVVTSDQKRSICLLAANMSLVVAPHSHQTY